VFRWDWPEDVRLVVATPAQGLATAKARAALPETLTRTDAVFNLQRVLAFVHALQSEEFDRLREAMQDRWHQSARAALVPCLADVLALEEPDVLGACLSGAGPSVAVLARKNLAHVERVLKSVYQGAGCPAVIRTLDVHQSVGAASAASGR
jgi:homoserine kinase